MTEHGPSREMTTTELIGVTYQHHSGRKHYEALIGVCRRLCLSWFPFPGKGNLRRAVFLCDSPSFTPEAYMNYWKRGRRD